MIIGLDANEANLKKRVGSNQYAFHVLWQLYRQDKKNNYQIYLKSKPLPILPQASKRWQYRVLKPKFFWTQWRLPLSLYFSPSRPDIFLTLGHYAPRFSPIPKLICIMDLAFLKFPNTFLKKDLLKLKQWTKASAQKAAHRRLSLSAPETRRLPALPPARPPQGLRAHINRKQPAVFPAPKALKGSLEM